MAEFLDHYTLVRPDDGVINTLDEARQLANGDASRIWFVREGDHLEEPWAVESWNGQFVNCLGFYVTIEPVRPEHKHEVFDY
jgi:hypothetical protein